MEIRRLDHCNIRSTKFQQTIEFYTKVLGFRHERTPRGAWLYDASGTPSIHMSNAAPEDPAALAAINAYLGERDPAGLAGSGAIDHVAFDSVGYEEVLGRCREFGCDYMERVTATGLRQIFISDPNGIRLELNFQTESTMV